MDDKKNITIKKVFETMEYGDDTENVTEAIEWLTTKNNHLFAYIDKNTENPTGELVSLKNRNNDETLCDIHVPESATVETILKKLGSTKNEWLEVPPIKRANILHKLGNEVQKQQNLFVQIEVATRGILSKDTKNKSLNLLTDYLQYYSSFSIKHDSDNPSWKPEGLVVGIFSEKNSLASLGCILGPCLASGYKIVLQTSPQFSLVVALLIDLATQVGIPEGTIRLIPGSIEPNVFFTHPDVSIVSVFDDLYKEKYLIGNHFGKKIINFYSSGIPMLVFDNADLDSACQSLIDATWGYKGILPWSVKHVYIQENVFENFVQKLKNRLDKIIVANGNKKNADISWPDNYVLKKLKITVEKAKSEGAEIYQSNSGSLIPTLLIGGNVFNNNVIKEDAIDVPILNLAAFRTINESVALANNTRQGLAACVWTESISLVNELIRKIKVSNVWINSHGLFSAEISLSPYKSSGNAYFGGQEGFYEFVQMKTLKSEPTAPIQKSEIMENAISDAKKAQESWCQLPRLGRIKSLQLVAQDIDANTKTWNLSEKWLQDWIISIHNYILSDRGESFTIKKGFNIMSLREPHGVVAIETLEDIETHNKKLIIAALIEGNSVIVLNDSKSATTFYSSISKLLPKGTFTIISSSQDATKVAALHKELNVYFGEKSNSVSWTLPLKNSTKFKDAVRDDWDVCPWNEVRNKVTLIKNVWSNVGQSFI